MASLTCVLSVLEFFDKLTRWLDMINASRRLQDHVSRVQSTLAVSTVIYKKYLRMFRAVFQVYTPKRPSDTDISTAQVFEFIWVALCAFKSESRLPSTLTHVQNTFRTRTCSARTTS